MCFNQSPCIRTLRSIWKTSLRPLSSMQVGIISVPYISVSITLMPLCVCQQKVEREKGNESGLTFPRGSAARGRPAQPPDSVSPQSN